MSDQKSLTLYDKDSLLRVFKGGEGTLLESGEQWGERVDVHEYLHDTPGFSGMLGRTMHRTQIDDRSDGKYLPVYDNEMDLSMIRAMSWLLKDRVPMAKAIEGRLLDYTIGNGFDWSITSKNAPESLVDRLNKDVERVFDENAWSGELERESFTREFDDGEFIMSMQLEGDSIRFEVHEGEELTEPLNPRDIEEWIGIEDYVPSWRFGVLTQKNRSDQPKGYHVVRNPSGTDWDFYPVEQFIHWKRNVRKSAKRGVTDFYTPHTYLMRGDRVFTNTAEGAAIQAAIAYILEHAEGVTKGQASAMSLNTLVNPRTDPFTNRSKSVQRVAPGTIRQVPFGQKYHAGMLGSNNSNIYIEVMEAALRLAGTIYSMPEGMITGTYENNSYASAETAVDPWVLGRKADQSTRERRKRQMIVQIIKLLHSMGRYQEFGNPTADELLAMVDIGVNAPDLWPKKVSNEEVTALVTQVQNGWLDDQSASTTLGHDYEQVQDRIKAGGHVKPKPTPQPGMGGDPNAVPGEEESPGDGSSVGQDAIDRVMARLTESEEELFTPPPAAQHNARKVLTWLESHGEVAGLTRVGIARVKRIASGLPVGRDVVERMASLREDCGTGDGGFKPGNECGGKGGSGGGGNVTQSQKNAVEDYTTDKFQTINSELRSGGPESKDTKKIVKEVDNFLANSPKREGATVRSFDIGGGDSEKIKSMLKEGGVFTDDAYVSTRKKPTLTDTIAFKDRSAPEGKVVMKVTGKSGVDISDISKNTGEGEVLYPRGTRFKVKKVVKTPQGGILAEVEELTDDSTRESLQESLSDSPWKDAEHVAFLGFGGAEGVEWAKKNVTFLESGCGTGAGGFKPGNTCGKGEGGKSLASSLSRAVPMSDTQSKEIAKLNPDGPVDGKVKIPKGMSPDQADDIKLLYPGSSVDSGKAAKSTQKAAKKTDKTPTKKSPSKTGRRSDSELESEFGPTRSKSKQESSKVQESIMAKQKKFTKAEEKAAKIYTSEEYTKINGALRSGESIDNVPPPELRKLNSKAAKSKLPPGTVLYAGVGEDTAKMILEGGDTFEHKGLRSTSVDPATAMQFRQGEPYVMEIKAKRGVAVDHISSEQGEMEVVQAHGTKYRVIGFQKNKKLGSSSDRGGRKSANVITLEEI